MGTMYDSSRISTEPAFHQPEFSLSSLGRRLLAYFVDGIIFGVLILILIFLCSPMVGLFPANIMGKALFLIFGFGLFLTGFFYEWILNAWFHATPGKLLCGMVLQSTSPHRGIDLGNMFYRALAKAVFFIRYVPVVGAAAVLIDIASFLMVGITDTKQAIHDRLAQTKVTDTRNMGFLEGLLISFSMLVLLGSMGAFMRRHPQPFATYVTSADRVFDIQDSEWFKNKTLTTPKQNTDPKEIEDVSSSFEALDLEKLQFVNFDMYREAFDQVTLPPTHINSNEIFKLKPAHIHMEREGLDLNLNIYMPVIANAMAYEKSTQLKIKPIYSKQEPETSLMATPMKWKTSEDFLHGQSKITQEDRAIRTLDFELKLKLPKNIKRIDVVSNQIQPEYHHAGSRYSSIVFDGHQVKLNFNGVYDHFLGLMAYDKQGDRVMVTQQTFKQENGLNHRAQFTFEQKPFRITLFCADGFFEKNIIGKIPLDHTFVELASVVVTFDQKPKTFQKASMDQTHMLKTDRYSVRIKDGVLSVDGFDLGKLNSGDWVHVGQTDVLINGQRAKGS